MADERFDPLLLSMCQGLNDMDGILNTFFSFLRHAPPLAAPLSPPLALCF